jgi:hypothetical protein
MYNKLGSRYHAAVERTIGEGEDAKGEKGRARRDEAER